MRRKTVEENQGGEGKAALAYDGQAIGRSYRQAQRGQEAYVMRQREKKRRRHERNPRVCRW